MYIIAGLGNPGRPYEHTRHNAGVMALDKLAARCGIDITEHAHKALIGKGFIEGSRVLLVKPQTFMNASGESIRSVMDYYKAEPGQLIVIYDDISLEPGMLRVRGKGSAGGHNGIKSIIACLGSQDFPRIRIGVGAKPERMDLADYVLGHFSRDELERMDTAFTDGAAAAVSMITEGISAAMNHFNGAARKPKPETTGQKEE